MVYNSIRVRKFYTIPNFSKKQSKNNGLEPKRTKWKLILLIIMDNNKIIRTGKLIKL